MICLSESKERDMDLLLIRELCRFTSSNRVSKCKRIFLHPVGRRDRLQMCQRQSGIALRLEGCKRGCRERSGKPSAEYCRGVLLNIWACLHGIAQRQKEITSGGKLQAAWWCQQRLGQARREQPNSGDDRRAPPRSLSRAFEFSCPDFVSLTGQLDAGCLLR